MLLKRSMNRSMNRSNNIIYIIIGLLLIYYLQGIIYTEGALSQIALFLYLGICSIYLIKTCLLKNRSDISNILIVFILVLGFYMIISPKTHYTYEGKVVSAITNYKYTCIALITFFPFYYLSRARIIGDKSLKLCFVVYFIIAILQFYNNSAVLNSKDEYGVAGQTVNNLAYNFVLLLPYIGLYSKNRKFSITMILICSFFIVSGLKRGAIIAGCAGVVIYFYYWLVELKHRRITSNSILVLLLSLIGGGLIYHFVTQNLFLLERFTELADGDSSGRDVIYSTIWDYWLLSDPWNMIFGYGFDASIDIAGRSAHNDWLELLSATGLVGIVIYFTFFVSVVKLINISTISIYDKTMLMMIFTIWVFLSMFSMAYNDGGLSSMTTLMGYIVGKNEIRYAVK